jgi:hypothetical protein
MSEQWNGESPRRSGHDDIRLDVVEGLVREIHTGSLDRVMKVSLRLMALASFADPPGRDVLLAQVEQLDAAVQNVRDTFFREHGATLPAPPAEPEDEEGRVEVALLDRHGVIVWTNRAWDDFCRDNGGDPGLTGTGRSYLAVCEDAQDAASADLARSIRTAIRGGLPIPARSVVSCAAPGRPRAFDTLVSTRFDDGGRAIGAIITLSEVGVAAIVG